MTFGEKEKKKDEAKCHFPSHLRLPSGKGIVITPTSICPPGRKNIHAVKQLRIDQKRPFASCATCLWDREENTFKLHAEGKSLKETQGVVNKVPVINLPGALIKDGLKVMKLEMAAGVTCHC